jgi:hypothetical protein
MDGRQMFMLIAPKKGLVPKPRGPSRPEDDLPPLTDQDDDDDDDETGDEPAPADLPPRAEAS